MQVSKRIQLDNIVRISSKKPIGEYAMAVLMRMQPNPYKTYDCIKLRFTADLITDVRWLCMMFGNAGLVTKEVNKIEKIEVGKGVILDNCWEATLKKIGALDFEEQEFEEYSRRVWEKINES